jgi:transposase
MPVAWGDIGESVRVLAQEYGISERTAWRWLGKMRAERSDEMLKQMRTEWTCLACGAELPAEATIRRDYCDAACRISHWRQRKRAAEHANHRSGT